MSIGPCKVEATYPRRESGVLVYRNHSTWNCRAISATSRTDEVDTCNCKVSPATVARWHIDGIAGVCMAYRGLNISLRAGRGVNSSGVGRLCIDYRNNRSGQQQYPNDGLR